MTSRRVIFWLVVAAGLAVIATSQTARAIWTLVAFTFDRTGPSGCAPRQIKGETTSSDGAWIATSYSDICVEGPWVTVHFDSIEIRRPHEAPSPTPKKAVVAKDYVMHDPPLAVTWLAPRVLEITLPNLSRIGTQQTKFADVDIVYKYVPDDPVDRICTKRWRFLMSDGWRLDRPPPNEEAFFADCRGAPGPQR